MKNKISGLIFILFSLASAFFLSISPNQGLSQDKAGSQKDKVAPPSQWAKQWLEEVVPYIITSAEKAVFLALRTEEERGEFIDTFWKKRDPNPRTPQNEFKLEYYKRIALANKFFNSSGLEGWRTDRGKTYILLGPPNDIQRDMNPSGSSALTFHGPKETWNYWDLPNPKLPYAIEFIFVDKFGTGSYVLDSGLGAGKNGSTNIDMNSLHEQFNYMENMAEAMRTPFENIDKLKGLITTEATTNLIPLRSHLFCLKGEKEKTFLPIVLEIAASSLSQKAIGQKNRVSLTLVVNVSDSLGQIVIEKNKNFDFEYPPSEIKSLADEAVRLQTSVFLNPAVYKIHFLVMDNFSGKIGTHLQEISIPEYTRTELSMSDIILSPLKTDRSQPINREGRSLKENIFAEASQVFSPGEELNLYFEVYNVSLDPKTGFNDVKLEFSFFQNGVLLTRAPSLDSKPTTERECLTQTSFRLKNFKPGEYVLRAKVIDSISGKSAFKDVSFQVTQ